MTRSSCLPGDGSAVAAQEEDQQQRDGGDEQELNQHVSASTCLEGRVEEDVHPVDQRLAFAIQYSVYMIVMGSSPPAACTCRSSRSFPMCGPLLDRRMSICSAMVRSNARRPLCASVSSSLRSGGDSATTVRSTSLLATGCARCHRGPGADDDVDRLGTQPRDHLDHVGHLVLAVRVERDEVLGAGLGPRVLDTGLQCAALAEVDRMPHEVRPGGPDLVRGAVLAAVVHAHHVRETCPVPHAPRSRSPRPRCRPGRSARRHHCSPRGLPAGQVRYRSTCR